MIDKNKRRSLWLTEYDTEPMYNSTHWQFENQITFSFFYKYKKGGGEKATMGLKGAGG